MPLGGLLYPLGLFAFLFLVPFLLLYLIRPRPKSLRIPSLMFYLQDMRQQKEFTFFRKLLSDPLFWIQLFVFCLLALAVAGPYADLPRDVAAQHTVIVLDVSASTQAVGEDGKIRFLALQDRALDLVSPTTSIVLAGASPLLALERGDTSEAKRVLRAVSPSDTETALGDAILLAGEILGGDAGRVFVLSDFVSTRGMHPDVARRLLESKDIVVDFISFSLPTSDNVGLVNLAVDDVSTSVYVKNYRTTPAAVPLLIDEKLRTTLSLAPGAMEPYVFSTLRGITKISLDLADSFAVDNVAYVAVPDKEMISVLLVSSASSKYIRAALEATGVVTVTEAEPPIIPTSGYDVYLFSNVVPEDILYGTIKDILASISESGGSLIFYGQPDLSAYRDYLPVHLTSRLSGQVPVEIQTGTKITQDVAFERTRAYWNATVTSESALVLAVANGAPVIVLDSYGRGKVLYYGLEDESSDFKLSPSYPIFWARMIKYLGSWPELYEVNLHTGDSVSPYGLSSFADLTLLDKVGVFEVGADRFAVNLLSERESDLSGATLETPAVPDSAYSLETVKRSVTYEFLFILLILALVLLVIELIYMQRRGVF